MRQYHRPYFGPQLKGEKKRLVSVTRPDVLFLSVATKFNHKQLLEVYEWFAQLGVMQVDDVCAIIIDPSYATGFPLHGCIMPPLYKASLAGKYSVIFS